MQRRARQVTSSLLLLILFGGCDTADVDRYPGATLDKPMTTKWSKMARGASRADEVSVYTTRDPFERVVDFYAKRGIEHEPAWAKVVHKLPDGREIKVKVFVLDGKSEPTESKRWVQVQHPFVGDAEMVGTTPRYHDVRDMTVIAYSSRK